jgi:alkanesulfonate monooxygenase SsuD/methylene tetrahydromethanopterin reductase-like flavin-dependent oxidoreductase (luciferase family)
MSVDAKARESHRKTNPVFNDRKLKLGTFGTNLDRGCAISTIDGVLEINWPNTLELARCSEEMEFEALVPIGRWHGFGGHTNFNGPGFECFSWASAIGASTRYSGIFATSHVPTIHPVMAAKQATTIDHVTQGRFALNIVTGWNRPEIEMFGSPLMEHDDRYECAVEWLDIMKKLWTRDEPFDFEGRFYKIKKGYLQPKPIQRPFPAVMNAGGSPKGQHFAAKHCDMVYVVFGSHDFDECKAKIDAYRSLARQEYGREIQVWSYAYVVQGETEKEAQAYFDEYVNQKGDWDAVDNLVTTMIANAKTLPKEVLAEMKKHFIAGWGGYPIIGTPEQIVDGLITMSKMGLDGTLLNWPRYIEDQRWFQKHVYPLVQQAGLR